MKTKNFDKKTALRNNLSGNKIIIIFSIVIFACIFANSKDAKAGTCATAGGTCTSGTTSKTCLTGYEYVGLYDCSDSAPNCCKKSTSTTTTAGSTSSSGGITLPTGTGLSSSTIAAILAGLLKWLLAIFGFLAIMSFIITGIMYLTSTGDDARQEKAKNQMMWSILGVIVGLSGYVAVQAITSWMSGGSQF